MKKILFVMLIFIMGAAYKSGPAIQIVTEDVELGEVQKGGIFNYVIEVKNIGNQDLIIENVYASCGCLEVSDKRWPGAGPVPGPNPVPTHVVIEPKKSTFISVKLDTNKVSGVFEKMLHIISNDPVTKDAAWKIRGVVLDSPPAADRSNSIALPQYSSSEAPKVPSREDAKAITVFYSPGCNDCREIMEKFLPGIKEKYNEKISIVYYDIDRPEAFAYLLDLINKYDKRSKKGFFNPRPPVVVVGDRLLYGTKEIKKHTEELIKN
jgi:thiol-disulfide isomerase/thioredoxin